MTELLSDYAASFRRDLRAANKADRTITIYLQSVRFFSDWLAAQDRPATLDALTRPAIRAWLADLADKQAPTTVLTRYRGMRRFVRWLHAEGELESDVMAGMEKPSVPERPVPVLSDDEIRALLKTCDARSFEGRRDEAVIRILLDAGVRISEVSRLVLDDLNLNQELIRVVGKGNKMRVVPFGAKTARAIDRYLRLRKVHRLAALDALWLGQRGGWTADAVDDMLRRRARAAGVENLHAHRFRHTAASDWLGAGGQEQDLKRLMGWSSDAMLSVYGSATATQRAQDAHRRLGRGDRV